MTIEYDNIIYELIDDPDNNQNKIVKIIKCLSNNPQITIPGRISFPVSNGNVSSRDFEVQEISDCAFKDCENLKEIKFEDPNNIKVIGISAFENCISLKSFYLPPYIKKISSRCFFNCIRLKKVKSENSQEPIIETIEESAFENCTNLQSIEGINIEKTETISKFAFKKCFMLSIVALQNHTDKKGRFKSFLERKTKRKIVINSNHLKTIEDGAFENCSNVTITGKMLSYSDGSNYEKNINPAMKKVWTSLKKAFIVLFSLLIFFLMLFIFLKNDIGTVISLISLLICTSIYYYNCFIHKRKIIALSGFFFFLMLTSIIVYAALDLPSSNNDYLYKQIAVIDGTIEEILPDNSINKSDISVRNVNYDSYKYNIVDKDSVDKLQSKWSIIEFRSKESVKIYTSSSKVPISNFIIEFDNTNKSIGISISTDEINKLYYKLNEGKKIIEIPSENCDYSFSVGKCNSIVILSDSKDDESILLKLDFPCITDSNNSNLISFSKMICGGLLISFAFLSVLFFVIYLSEKQESIEKNKILILIILIVVYIAIEIYTKKSIPDIAHDILTATLGI